MIIDKVSIKLLGDKYEECKEKPIKDSILSNFNFDDGIHAKDLAKFLEHLRDEHGYKFCGETECHITIKEREY